MQLDKVEILKKELNQYCDILEIKPQYLRTYYNIDKNIKYNKINILYNHKQEVFYMINNNNIFIVDKLDDMLNYIIYDIIIDISLFYQKMFSSKTCNFYYKDEFDRLSNKIGLNFIQFTQNHKPINFNVLKKDTSNESLLKSYQSQINNYDDNYEYEQHHKNLLLTMGGEST